MINKHGVSINIIEDNKIELSGSVGICEAYLVFKDHKEIRKKFNKDIEDIDCIDLLDVKYEDT